MDAAGCGGRARLSPGRPGAEAESGGWALGAFHPQGGGAARRHEDGMELLVGGHLPEDLHPDRPLPRDDVRVVERRDEHAPLRPRELLCVGLRSQGGGRARAGQGGVRAGSARRQGGNGARGRGAECEREERRRKRRGGGRRRRVGGAGAAHIRLVERIPDEADLRPHPLDAVHLRGINEEEVGAARRGVGGGGGARGARGGCQGGRRGRAP